MFATGEYWDLPLPDGRGSVSGSAFPGDSGDVARDVLSVRERLDEERGWRVTEPP